MTTFAYTSGNPANLTGGHAASMSDISGPFTDIPTFLNGNITAVNVTDGGLDNDTLDASTVAAKVGLSQTGSVRRGKSIIATEESRTNVAYGTLTTPDQVLSVVLPTDGFIAVVFQALFKSSVGAAGAAAIFLGATQLKARTSVAAPTALDTNTQTANRYDSLTTNPTGLSGSEVSGADYTSDVTTGQSIGVSGTGGPCYIFAAAGTYDVSVRFKSSSGSVTAKERKLWVWTMGF